MKILITGGTGRLAFELKKHLEGEYVGIENFDFTYNVPKGEYDLILHMGAWTDVKKAQSEPEKCFDTNVKGTWKISQAYPTTPIVYISTEYAYKPMGIYAKTTRLGEEIIKDHTAPYLILRTSFKPNPFPFPKAYTDQYTQGDSIDIIAKLLANKINSWDFVSSFEYLGTGRKTIFELAKKTRPDVLPMKVADYVNVSGAPIPLDYE